MKPCGAAWSAVVESWRNLLDRDGVLILDAETTGLGPRAEVVELAVIDTTGRTRLHGFALPRRMPTEAARVHGLDRAKLQVLGAVPWPEIHPEVCEVLGVASVVLAWNAGFDARVLGQTAARYGVDLPSIEWRDLLADYRTLGHQGNRLHQATAREGVKVPGDAHRALGDCRRVLALMRAVCRPE